MTFARVKVSGWATNEILTSAQQNQLDIDHANAVDGAAGGTYNLSAYLEFGTANGIKMKTGTTLQMQSGSVLDVATDGDISIPLIPVFVSGANVSFTRTGGPSSNAAGWFAGNTSTPFIYVPIPVPVGNGALQIKSISVTYHPASGHGALPAVMPSLQLWKQGAGAGAETQLGSTATDAAGSVVAYEAPRTLTVTTTQSITTSDAYYFIFQYESGANSLANTLVTGARLVHSRTLLV